MSIQNLIHAEGVSGKFEVGQNAVFREQRGLLTISRLVRTNVFDVVAKEVATSRAYGEGATGLRSVATFRNVATSRLANSQEIRGI
jgi:hypothetical protein